MSIFLCSFELLNCLYFPDQVEALNEELVRRREECVHLRTVLASNAHSSKDGDRETSLLNEDGELEMAYKTQKDLNKLVSN